MTKDEYTFPINDSDYGSGKLAVKSNIRPNRIFTADKNIIIKRVALLNNVTVSRVVQNILAILSE